jgi:hypothetical protein
MPSRGKRFTIDFDGNLDYCDFCPLSFNLAGITNQVYHAIKIYDLGGLEKYYKVESIDSLPHITVYFYRLAIAAMKRYNAERENVRANLIKRVSDQG